MLCPGCGADNGTTNAFCGTCGTPLGPMCAACGHVSPLNARFCGRCGTPLAAPVPSGHSSEQLLRALSARGGERKRLTVMFADIRNSTGLIDRIDPEDAMRRMQPAIDAMRSAVDRYGGVVNRVQGDGVMALFGAPRSHEDHAVRACLAALAMQDAVARFGDPEVSIRVGLHTGEVVVQAVETSLYQTYDAAGAVVHLASRMEQMAEGGGILLTADTLAAARQFIQVKPLGPQAIRGMLSAVEVFKLVGVRNAPASELFRSRPHLSRLTGRQQQVDAVEAALADAAGGDARVVGVVGEEGVGKSRLCFEFAESCRRRGIRVYEARVLAHGRATPFQPVLELLRASLGVRAGDPAEATRRRIASVVGSLPGGGEGLPLLLDFLGLADAAYPVPRLDPLVRKTRLMELICNLARSAPRDQATVVLVEDLHWIDAASEEFIEALADAVIGTPTLLLLNFRPDYSAAWMRRSHYRQINVSRLDPANADDLLRDLLGDDASLALVSRNIAWRAQGNPFFIEELVNSLVERGDFQGTRGAYRLAGGIDTVPLPATVEALLAARIDRLEEHPKQVLQSAAVIGRELPVAILEAVTNLQPAEIADALRQLRQAELLHELPPHEGALHAFRHPLIQEVAYRSLLHTRQRTIHAAVAAAIKTHFKDRVEEWASLLAYHLEQAGDTMQAAQANIRAALWFGSTDASQALRTWKKVHDLLNLQPPSESIAYLRSVTCHQIMNFGWREGMSAEEAKGYFEEAKELALAAGNLRGNAALHAVFGRILAASGSADEYVSRIRKAEALVGESSDASLQVTLKAVLCHALRLAGRLQSALTVNIEATNRAHEIGEFDRGILGFDIERWLTVMRGQLLILLGRFDEARPYLDRLLQVDAAQRDITSHVACVAYVDLAWAEGDAHLAEAHAAQAIATAVNGSPYEQVHARACRGLSHIVAGRLDSAVEDLAETLSYARRRRAGLEIEARTLALLASAYRLKGDLASGLQAADEAIDVATARRARVPESFARIVRAEILWKMGGAADQIGAEIDRARALMEETGAAIYRPVLDDLVSRRAGGTSTTAKRSSPPDASLAG